MNLEFYLSIIGVILTVLFGVHGVIKSINREKNKKLYFIVEYMGQLYKKSVQENPDFSLLYKGNAIGASILQFQGTIINGTNHDLDKSMIYKEIEISLPECYSIKHIEIIRASKTLQVSTEIFETTCRFEWDILKRNEYFSFDMIIEIVDKEIIENKSTWNILSEFKKGISVTHRIKDVDPIKIHENNSSLDSLFSQLFFAIILALFSFASLHHGYGKIFIDRYEKYYEIVYKNKREFYNIDVNDGGLILKDYSGKTYEVEIEALKELYFSGNSNNKLLPRERKSGFSFMLFGILLLIAIIWYNLKMFKERRSLNEINSILKKKLE